MRKLFLQPATKVVKQILVSVHFGMPSKNCRNHGVCYIASLSEDAPIFGLIPNSDDRQGMALLTILPDRKVELAFLKASLCSTTLKQFFSGESFLIEEAYHCPAALSNELACEEPIVIPAGAYPIIESDSVYSIHIH